MKTSESGVRAVREATTATHKRARAADASGSEGGDSQWQWRRVTVVRHCGARPRQRARGAEAACTTVNDAQLMHARVAVSGASAVGTDRERDERRSAHGGGSGGWRSLCFVANKLTTNSRDHVAITMNRMNSNETCVMSMSECSMCDGATVGPIQRTQTASRQGMSH